MQGNSPIIPFHKKFYFLQLPGKIFSQTIQQQPPQPPPPEFPNTDISPAKKKRPGRPAKKAKKDQNASENSTNGLEENMVSSSSQEPRVASIAVQTPSKLLKDLISTTSKISKEELRQLKEKVVLVCNFLKYIYMYLVCIFFVKLIFLFP